MATLLNMREGSISGEGKQSDPTKDNEAAAEVEVEVAVAQGRDKGRF